jgi:hypothetical protein
MQNSVKITLIIVVGVLLLTGIGYYAFGPKGPTINMNGQATVKAMPDLATVYFSIEGTGNTSSEATRAASSIVDKMTNVLLAQGFSKEDIITQSFSVNEDCQWSRNGQVCDGYKAYHSIKIEMPSSESAKLGNVIDAGVNAGAGVSYISFELSPDKQNEYKKQAMAQATQDATAKASGIAEGLGKDLGKVVSVSVNEYGYMPYRAYESAAGVASMDSATVKASVANIVPGEQDVSASVNVVFRLA